MLHHCMVLAAYYGQLENRQTAVNGIKKSDVDVWLLREEVRCGRMVAKRASWFRQG